jgi:phage-related minor tail protein
MYQQAVKFLADKTIAALFQSFGPGGNGGSSFFSNLAGGLGFGGGGGSLSVDTSGLNSQALSMGPVFNANGNAYNSPSLSAYSGQIVSSPTMFTFAHGAGIMGEAGPEAIMPLKRTNSGKLGVQVSGQGSGGVSVVQNIIVSGLVNRQTQDQLAQKTSQRQRMAVARNG